MMRGLNQPHRCSSISPNQLNQPPSKTLRFLLIQPIYLRLRPLPLLGHRPTGASSMLSLQRSIHPSKILQSEGIHNHPRFQLPALFLLTRPSGHHPRAPPVGHRRAGASHSPPNDPPAHHPDLLSPTLFPLIPLID